MFSASADCAMEDQEEVRILGKANATEQTSLVKENVPDAMDAEQTFPTDEEIALSREGTMVFMNFQIKY